MRISRLMVVAGALTVVPGSALAQHDEHGEHESPYAGMEASEIPALTAQELEDLRSGAGMGFAKAAELNSYPGPRHVLELAEALELTGEQRREIETIHAEMKARAVELGEAIIEAEKELDRRFKHQHIDNESLSEATGKIGGLYGTLRATHLRAHLATTDALTEWQVAEYDRLRGYAPDR